MTVHIPAEAAGDVSHPYQPLVRALHSVSERRQIVTPGSMNGHRLVSEEFHVTLRPAKVVHVLVELVARIRPASHRIFPSLSRCGRNRTGNFCATPSAGALSILPRPKEVALTHLLGFATSLCASGARLHHSGLRAGRVALSTWSLCVVPVLPVHPAAARFLPEKRPSSPAPRDEGAPRDSRRRMLSAGDGVKGAQWRDEEGRERRSDPS